MGTTPAIAAIGLFAGNFAPRGWAFCQGQLLAISQNDALFSLVGTIYGGDGRTTFGLPDLRGRTAIHTGQGPGLSNRPMGQKSGSYQTTLVAQNLPSHTHTVTTTINLKAADQDGDTNGSDGNALGANAIDVDNSETIEMYQSSPDFSTGITLTGVNVNNPTVQSTGGNIPYNSMMPYLALNYCIALVGIYPSRS